MEVLLSLHHSSRLRNFWIVSSKSWPNDKAAELIQTFRLSSFLTIDYQNPAQKLIDRLGKKVHDF